MLPRRWERGCWDPVSLVIVAASLPRRVELLLLRWKIEELGDEGRGLSLGLLGRIDAGEVEEDVVRSELKGCDLL